MDVGIKVKQYLDDRGITQAFISTKTGIPPAKLSLSLNGKRRLSLAEYESICWALGTSAETFMEPRPPENTRA